jgi:adenylate kinase
VRPRFILQAQAEALASSLRVDAALCLDVPTDTIVARISQRRLHPPSGRVYADDYHPPLVAGRDDVTGEPLVQRDDDKVRGRGGGVSFFP